MAATCGFAIYQIDQLQPNTPNGGGFPRIRLACRSDEGLIPTPGFVMAGPFPAIHVYDRMFSKPV